MNKIALAVICLAILAPQPSHANEKVCILMSQAAERIMARRQDGTPLSDVLNTVKDSALSAFIKALAVHAYGTPRYHTPEYQQRAIDDFRDNILVTCLRRQ